MKSRKANTCLLISMILTVLMASTMVYGKSKSVGGYPALVEINAELEAMDADFRVYMAEWITTSDSPQFGQTVFAKDRGNKQMDTHFVPADPRRGGFSDIAYNVDQGEGATTSGLSNDDTEAAIDRAMDTWEEVRCSDIPLTKVNDSVMDLGVVQFLWSFGPPPSMITDISHAGWLPGAFFDLLELNGSTSILGVTFTFVFIGGSGNPTDIDGNGKVDTAFRETYYNDNFAWAIDTNIDVETVALHEAGHGLSQAHFGKIFQTHSNGKIHFAPRAVMNEAYSGVQQDLTGTDNGGHCSIWGAWPNN